MNREPKFRRKTAISYKTEEKTVLLKDENKNSVSLLIDDESKKEESELTNNTKVVE